VEIQHELVAALLMWQEQAWNMLYKFLFALGLDTELFLAERLGAEGYGSFKLGLFAPFIISM